MTQTSSQTSSRHHQWRGVAAAACFAAALAGSAMHPGLVQAQEPGLTLDAARRLAAQSSPSLIAARAAVEAAAGRERQAGAFPNPILSYGHEQTSGEGSRTSQNIAALEQRVEVGGQRSARVAAARLRREAAEARLAAAEADLKLEVTSAYASARAAARRAELAASAAAKFERAVAVMNQRLAAGDVSGYEARRVRLEAARYAALAAQAQLEQRATLVRLAQLLGAAPDMNLALLVAIDTAANRILTLPPDSVVAIALTRDPQLMASALDAQAAEADARLARRERIPTPSLLAGYKNERINDEPTASGFVAGIALPVPLWDRLGGARQAAEADARRVAAEVETARRATTSETLAALEAVRRAETQVAALSSSLGAEASAALRAAEAAYTEGEITLIEWLDAVRAYQEAETAYAAVLAESFTQRARLERMLGIALIQ